MKLKNVMTGLVALGFTASAFAASTTASTSSSNLENIYKTLEESPLSFSFYQETSAARNLQTDGTKLNDDKNGTDFVGVTGLIIPTLSYKFNDKNKLSWDYQFKYESKENTDGLIDRYRTNLNFTHSGIMNQAEHGVNVSLKLRQRFYSSGVNGGGATKGYTRPGISVNRTFSNGLYLGATAHMAFMFKKDLYSFKNGDNDKYFYVPASWGYSITDKLALGGSLEYYRPMFKGSDKPDTISWDSTLIDVSYAVAKKATIGFGISGNIASGDVEKGVELTRHLEDQLGYTGYLSLSVF